MVRPSRFSRTLKTGAGIRAEKIIVLCKVIFDPPGRLRIPGPTDQ